MPYCTIDDIKKLLPESVIINLSNDSAGATSVNTTNLAECIDQADREIDSYVSLAGHTVPLNPVPPLAANLSAKMAIWNLHLRKYFSNEMWKDEYNRCVKILERIAEGKMVLLPTTIPETASTASYATETRTQKFTKRTWRHF